MNNNGIGDGNGVGNGVSAAVVCRGLCKSYRIGGARQEVLSDLDLTVSAGEAAVVAGVSGSGKTTLLHLLGGLDIPDAGTVAVGGEDLFALSGAALAKLRNRRLGFVFQFHLLLPEFTAAENVAMPLLIRGENRSRALTVARDLLSQTGMAQFAEKRPAALSGGERQRVAVARALCGGAECVLADEPTGNLDRRNADAVFDLLLSQCARRKMALIAATHDSHLLARAGRFWELREGKLWRKENGK